jgi:hypothetical protein
MRPENLSKLRDRVVKAAEGALAARGYVSPLDVLVGIGWLDPGAMKRWQQGQVDYIERVVQTNLPRISQAMKLFRAWATAKGLIPSETTYVARTPSRQALRFSQSGTPSIERLYRTHWVSGELSEKKRERLAEKASRAPELVVIDPLNGAWACHRCGGTGGLIVMENPGPACLRCVGLDDLEFVPAGDALLTRRAKAKSDRFAVVVRFSRSRKRYERQGLLVEPQALTQAQDEIASRSPQGGAKHPPQSDAR